MRVRVCVQRAASGTGPGAEQLEAAEAEPAPVAEEAEGRPAGEAELPGAVEGRHPPHRG